MVEFVSSTAATNSADSPALAANDDGLAVAAAKGDDTSAIAGGSTAIATSHGKRSVSAALSGETAAATAQGDGSVALGAGIEIGAAYAQGDKTIAAALSENIAVAGASGTKTTGIAASYGDAAAITQGDGSAAAAIAGGVAASYAEGEQAAAVALSGDAAIAVADGPKSNAIAVATNEDGISLALSEGKNGNALALGDTAAAVTGSGKNMAAAIGNTTAVSTGNQRDIAFISAEQSGTAIGGKGSDVVIVNTPHGSETQVIGTVGLARDVTVVVGDVDSEVNITGHDRNDVLVVSNDRGTNGITMQGSPAAAREAMKQRDLGNGFTAFSHNNASLNKIEKISDQITGAINEAISGGLDVGANGSLPSELGETLSQAGLQPQTSKIER